MRLLSALCLASVLSVPLGCRNEPDDGFSRSDEVPQEDGLLTGRICAPSGDAVFAAEIAASAGGVVTEAFTDEAGVFRFENLPTGAYDFVARKGSYSVSFSANYTEGTTLDVGNNCLDPSTVRIAVVTGAYDSIGDLIVSLGLSVDVWSAEGSEQYLDLLTSPDELAGYDVIFFNCGMSESWAGQFDAIGDNLDQYVRNGGSLYVSDLAFPILEATRPGFLDMAGEDNFEAPRIGGAGTVTATILDPNLTVFFGGRTVDIEYDLGGWAVVQAVSTDAEVIARGTVPTFNGDLPDVPIVASMQLPGEGKMVYTTFHNEAQLTADMEAILFELILAL